MTYYMLVGKSTVFILHNLRHPVQQLSVIKTV